MMTTTTRRDIIRWARSPGAPAADSVAALVTITLRVIALAAVAGVMMTAFL
jgi:hypothetical protein